MLDFNTNEINKVLNWLICSFTYKMKMIWVNFKGFFTYKPINCRKDEEKEICKK